MKQSKQDKTKRMHGISIRSWYERLSEEEKDSELWVIFETTKEQEFCAPVHCSNMYFSKEEKRLYIDADNEAMREFLSDYFIC